MVRSPFIGPAEQRFLAVSFCINWHPAALNKEGAFSRSTKSAMQLWKSKHGQAPCRGGGLLMPREPEPERFDEAKAWECAGESVRNRIDLAFKIRAEWFPPFVKLQDKIGFDRILAALIMLPQNPIYAESVWRAMDFLHDWDSTPS
jgi:hypothetical protein